MYLKYEIDGKSLSRAPNCGDKKCGSNRRGASQLHAGVLFVGHAGRMTARISMLFLYMYTRI
jgi:hypothetical protein